MAAYKVIRTRDAEDVEIGRWPTQDDADAVVAECEALVAGLSGALDRGVQTAVFYGRDLLVGDTFAAEAVA
jgi:hypothetical protein